jgi:DNA repair photolyase
MHLTETRVKSILTRSAGYLRTVCSHSAQPYRGCSLGRSLCGVGCYVQHNRWLTRGATWGSFLEARVNAAERYVATAPAERRWARRTRGSFAIFMSSSTDPFVPQERQLGVTRGLLEAMLEEPPDALILQTHSHAVTRYLELYRPLASRCRLRVQISVETDRERVPGLPAPASSVGSRLEAAGSLSEEGLDVAIAVAPLLPLLDPEAFFGRIAAVAGSVIIDHFVGGDGSRNGARTRSTPLPGAMASLDPTSVELEYRDRMVAVARRYVSRVGVGIDGFAGRWLPGPSLANSPGSRTAWRALPDDAEEGRK